MLNCSHKPNYNFTLQEIKEALGYASSTKTADMLIKDILTSFQKEGVIKIDKEWFECISNNGTFNKTERMILKFIATDRSQF